VNDTLGGQCATRVYAFNAATDRTGLTSYNPATDGTCQTTTAVSATIWTYDSADRVNTAGYVYDTLGRTTTLPAADTQNPAGGNLTSGYHTNDLVRSLTQNGVTNTYTLDVDNHRIRSWTDGSATHINHYGGTGDVSSWTDEGAGVDTRIVRGLGGISATTVSGATTVVGWRLTNLHGDFVAQIDGSSSGLTSVSEATEFGILRNTDQVGTLRYGWLGQAQRSSDTPSGVLLDGSRVYNPGLGRFLQVDPAPGSSSNSYDYCLGDSQGCQDTSGNWPLKCSSWQSFGDSSFSWQQRWYGSVATYRFTIYSHSRCKISDSTVWWIKTLGKAWLAGMLATGALACGPGAVFCGVLFTGLWVIINDGIDRWYGHCPGHGITLRATVARRYTYQWTQLSWWLGGGTYFQSSHTTSFWPLTPVCTP